MARSQIDMDLPLNCEQCLHTVLTRGRFRKQASIHSSFLLLMLSYVYCHLAAADAFHISRVGSMSYFK